MQDFPNRNVLKYASTVAHLDKEYKEAHSSMKEKDILIEEI